MSNKRLTARNVTPRQLQRMTKLNFSRLVDLSQYCLLRHLVLIANVMFQQVSQNAMRDLLFRKFCRRFVHVMVNRPLRLPDAILYVVAIGLGVGFGQRLGVRIGPGVYKVFGVKDLFQIRQHRHQVVPGGVPAWIRRLDVEFPRLLVDVRIVNTAVEYNLGPHVGVVVSGWKLQFELENAVGEWSPSHEDDSVEVTQTVHRGDQIDPSRSVHLQMFVFNSDLVISEGLFALFLLEIGDARRGWHSFVISSMVGQSIGRIRAREKSVVWSQTILQKLLEDRTTSATTNIRNDDFRVVEDNVVPFIFILVALLRAHCDDDGEGIGHKCRVVRS